MYCSKCGSYVADDANFCANCVAPVRQVYNVNVGGQNQFKQNPMPAADGGDYAGNGTYGNISRDNVGEEFKNFFVVCIIPIVYFVYIIIRDIFYRRFQIYDSSLYEILPIVSLLFYGIMLGGMVVAVNNGGRYMRWFYIIPYALLCIKWTLTSFSIDNIIYNISCLAEIFIVLGISTAMQRVKIANITGAKNAVVAVISGAAVVAFEYIFLNILVGAVINGYNLYFDSWDIYVIIFTIGGAALGAVINTVIVKVKMKI